jgi:hypothetical protein
MSSQWRLRISVVALALALVTSWRLSAGGQPAEEKRQALNKQITAGNFKDAYDGLRKLALDPQDDPKQVGKDLTQAIVCLQRLGRVDEVDAFRDAVIAAHKGNWRLLATAAKSFTDNEHHGFMVVGKFNRGNARGQGRYVNSLKRDRVRALQLYEQAARLIGNENDKQAVGEFYLQFAGAFLTGGGPYEPWRLQYLTDLADLPDYDEGYFGYYAGTRGAPVDEKGNPILYYVPKSYDKAANDGERWRWLLTAAGEAGDIQNSFLNVPQLSSPSFLNSKTLQVTSVKWNPATASCARSLHR